MEATVQGAPGEFVLDDGVLRDLRKRSTPKGLLQTLVILSAYAALGLAGAAINVWWLWPAIWWMQAVILAGFIDAAHECVHRTFVTSAAGNRIAGILWSAGLLMNFSLFKHYHLSHHKYAGTESDTEAIGRFPNVWTYFRLLFLTGFYVSFWVLSAKAMGDKYPYFVKSKRGLDAVKVDNLALLAWMAAMLAVTILWPREAFFFYWIPLALCFPLLSITSLPEHYGCDEVTDPLRNTRTLTSNFVLRYLCWNANYHAEHHAFPSVPSHNLPRLHRLIRRHLVFQHRSYVLFHLGVIWTLIRASDEPSPACGRGPG